MSRNKKISHKSKILLITTRGCEGCAIIRRLIEEAISISKKDVELTVKDASDIDKKWLKHNRVTDFPTTFLVKDDVIKYKFVGTVPAIVISQWIKVNL